MRTPTHPRTPRHIACAAALAAALVAPGRAANEHDEAVEMTDMVITATRTEVPLSEVGRAVTVITRQDIVDSGADRLTDLLRLTPGLDYRSPGPNAGGAGIAVRGLSSYHTKLLLNGIPLQDNSAPQTSPTLADIRLGDVERIEIIRGTHSTLYGSNAIGGVINVITRAGGGATATAPPRLTLGTEGGSHGAHRFYATAAGAADRLDYFLSSSFYSENGISARNNTPLNDDNDGYRNQQHAGQLRLRLADNVDLTIFGRFSDSDEEYDNGSPGFPPFFPATPDTGEMHLQYGAVGATLAATGLFDIWDVSLTQSHTDTQRAFLDDTGFSIGAKFESTTDLTQWQNTLHLDDRNDLTLGYDRTREAAETTGGTDADHVTDALFAEHRVEVVDNLFLSGGVRYNSHSTFGHETTWSASASYLIETSGTQLKTSWGEGYRSPSLFELFDPTNGNPALKPETSESWDIGFEQKLAGGKIRFGATYFRSRVDDFIDWVLLDPVLFTGQYRQVSGIKSRGVESFVELRPTDNLSVALTHTYTHTNDMQADTSPLAYRPRHKGSADITYRFLDNAATVNLNASYVGHQNVSAWDPPPTHLDDYLLVNLACSWQVTEKVRLFARVDNLLNENYEVARTYNTYDRSAFIGAEITLGGK